MPDWSSAGATCVLKKDWLSIISGNARIFERDPSDSGAATAAMAAMATSWWHWNKAKCCWQQVRGFVHFSSSCCHLTSFFLQTF
jgi:hypothetical protein